MKRIATLILATVFCSSYLIDCQRRLSMRQRRSQRRQSRSRRQKSKRLQNQRQSQPYLRATGRAPRPAKYTRRCRLRTTRTPTTSRFRATKKLLTGPLLAGWAQSSRQRHAGMVKRFTGVTKSTTSRARAPLIRAYS